MSNTKTAENQLPSISVFGKKVEGSILIPEVPTTIRNNCQSGCWAMGKEEYSSKGLEIAIVKFTPMFGDLGMTSNTLWGQIWFVAETGELPLGVLMCTYIKTLSLKEFNYKVTEVMARGIDPGMGLFMPTFVKNSTQKPDDSGVMKPANYYSLIWDWKPRTTPEEQKRLGQIADLFSLLEQVPAMAQRLSDPEGESRMNAATLASDEPLALKSAQEAPALPAAR